MASRSLAVFVDDCTCLCVSVVTISDGDCWADWADGFPVSSILPTETEPRDALQVKDFDCLT